jgi:CubicO group peptidase (beta-lactamase class C family)
MPLGDATARRCEELTRAAQIAGRAPSVVAAILRDGAPVWQLAIGDAVVGGQPAGPDTRYRIGSITKTLTAMLVLQLRDEGALDLTDAVGRHLLDAPLADARIGDLLAHAGGAAREPGGPWWERNPGVDFATLTVRAVEPRVLPARRLLHYSNLAYGVLGEVVARLRGSSWRAAVTDRVLTPLGMTATTYDAEAPHATGYDVHPYADVVAEAPAYDSGAMAPAGQLWSTVGDLLRLGRHLVDPVSGVLAADTVAELRTPQVVAAADGWEIGYGLGVFLFREGSRVYVGHAGSMPGFVAGLAVDPDSGVGAAVVANCYQGPDPVDLAISLSECVLAHEPPLPPPWQPGPPVPAEVAELLGPWYWGSSPYVVTARAAHPGELLLARGTAPDGAASRFADEGADRWRGVAGAYVGERLDVLRGADGQPDEIVLTTYRMRRTPYAEPPAR